MKFSGKFFVFAILSVVVSVVFFAGFLEIVLRFLPVNEGLSSMPVNEDSPILRFTPHRTSVWSRTWNFSRRNVVMTNNYGFISNVDYEPHGNGALVAIIGDSYVEAAMIPWEHTVTAQLQHFLGTEWRVYAFGASGAALSQYVAYAEYVSQEFQPDILVCIIVGNDFDESVLKYKTSPGFHYFVEDDDQNFVLQRVDYTPGIWRQLLRKSALGMYLATNLNISHAYFTVKNMVCQEEFVANTRADVDEERITDSRKAVDTFLDMLLEKTQLEPGRILCVLDGMRPQLYAQETLEASRGSYYELMRRYFLNAARNKGILALDMQPVFIADYQKNAQRFEFPDDGHWNAIGHELVAKSILNSNVFSRQYE